LRRRRRKEIPKIQRDFLIGRSNDWTLFLIAVFLGISFVLLALHLRPVFEFLLISYD
jgi:hypothetical protein